MALHWPQTTCETINNNENEDCECEMGNSITENLNDWKVHGYWPVDVKGENRF